MTVREANRSDVPAMARVMVDTFLAAHRGQIPEEVWQWRRQNWTYEVSARGWERTVKGIVDGSSPSECLYVAERWPGEIIGIAGGAPAASDPGGATGEVYALYVHPDHQGRGAGRLLVAAVADHFAQIEVSALHIGVLEANLPARGFYEALGGRIVGERYAEDAGFQLPEVIYGWSDLSMLAPETYSAGRPGERYQPGQRVSVGLIASGLGAAVANCFQHGLG